MPIRAEFSQRVGALLKKYESSNAGGFEDFERELYALFAQTECAVTEEALAHHDVDLPFVFVDGQMHRRACRCAQTYLTAAGPVSVSRPQVSDDNPFSEAQFKTLKYHPGFPSRFDDIHAAIALCRSFFPWYNTEHRHGGIAMLTPDDVHHGRAHTVLQQREQTLRAAWSHHPERFVRGIPKPLPLPEAVWINPPATSTTEESAQ